MITVGQEFYLGLRSYAFGLIISSCSKQGYELAKISTGVTIVAEITCLCINVVNKIV